MITREEELEDMLEELQYEFNILQTQNATLLEQRNELVNTLIKIESEWDEPFPKFSGHDLKELISKYKP